LPWPGWKVPWPVDSRSCIMGDEDTAFIRQVRAKAARKLKAQRTADHTVWFGLGMMGLIGWSVAMPTLFGILLGAWLDRHHPGAHSWTLALLAGGLIIGCVNAWRWVSRELYSIDEAPDGHDE
jgi:ATP synthase protein I